MKIEKLAEDKIKITITIDDLAERNIDLYSFMYNSPESQDLFWDVMNEAEKEYGFNVDDSMIYVEASTSGGGNFTLIVTKAKEKTSAKVNTLRPSSINKENVKLKRKKMPSFMRDGIYKFESFEDVINFCSTFEDNRSVVDTKLYSYNGAYYMKAGIMPVTSIMEYATVIKYPILYESKLIEHGNVVIENDVLNVINSHFNNKKKRKKAKKAE